MRWVFLYSGGEKASLRVEPEPESRREHLQPLCEERPSTPGAGLQHRWH